MSVETVKISITKQILLGLLGLVIILLAIEILSYVILDQRDSCNQSLPMSGLYEQLDVNELKKICQDYKSIIQYPLPIIHYEPNQRSDTVNINSYGFRGNDFEKEKLNEEEFRIFVLGGSVLYGLYSTSDETTISGYLQNYFDESNANYNVNVINAGANGHSSFDETILIKNKILDLDPDLIIVFDGWNDLAKPIMETSDEYAEMEKFAQYSLVIRKYYKTIQLYELVERIWEKQFVKTVNTEPNIENMQEKGNLWQKRWNEICELSQKENFDIILTLQPYLGGGDKPLTEWEKKSFKEFEHMSPSSSYYIMKEKLGELDNCSTTKDLTKIFDTENELIYFDYVHFGDKGNKIVAKELFDISSPLLKNK
mgnify:CR=1 FL=1|tara:strand:- start:270 stop:1376 length:1107 start_codon:yes stop_codon:yes gene_type:complete